MWYPLGAVGRDARNERREQQKDIQAAMRPDRP